MKLRVPPQQKNSQGIESLHTPLRDQIAYIYESLSETARIAYKALLAKLTSKSTKS